MKNEKSQKNFASFSRPDANFLADKTILVTGGTGSFGKRFVNKVLRETKAAKIIVFSRDELKQSEMQRAIPDPEGRLRYFIGDVRDKERLRRAFHGVDYVIHAAALKQVPTLEYNPFEAVLTNVVGSQNVIDAAIDQGVSRVVALSTDKAANPANLYGATKLCSEKLFVAGNSYSGAGRGRFSVVRYGNVIGSRGSVIPLFLAQRSQGILPVTDERMTRFWISLDQGVHFVAHCLRAMEGGEVFVPKIASMRIVDLAKTVAPECRIEIVGVRPGEKLHEVLVTEEESTRVSDRGSYYAIEPAFRWWNTARPRDNNRAQTPPFKFTSENNSRWLSGDDIEELVKAVSSQ